MKDTGIHVGHILECSNWIQQYTADGKESFLADRKTQSAVMRELQTLAESTQRLPSELKQRHAQIPWKDISGLRNVLVHAYLGVNIERIWEIVERDMAPLRVTMEAMRDEIAGSSGAPSTSS